MIVLRRGFDRRNGPQSPAFVCHGPAHGSGNTSALPSSRRNPMLPRRTILVALAAAAITSSLAQTPSEKMPSAEAGSDQEYVRQSLAASSLALAVSRIAAAKAQIDDLTEF